MLTVYSVFRFLTMFANLWIPRFKNAANGLTIVAYVSLMVCGQYYGQQLLRKMKQMSDKEFKHRLVKLTGFIILENITLVLLLLVYVVRTYFFGQARYTRPYEWFWLKSLEKSMEALTIIVLALITMGDSGKKADSKSKASSSAGEGQSSVRRAKKRGAGPATASAASTAPARRASTTITQLPGKHEDVTVDITNPLTQLALPCGTSDPQPSSLTSSATSASPTMRHSHSSDNFSARGSSSGGTSLLPASICDNAIVGVELTSVTR